MNQIFLDTIFTEEPFFYPKQLEHFHFHSWERMEKELHNDSTSPSQQKKVNKSFKDLVQDFADYTTAHGIGRLGASQTLFGKIFWSLCCLGAFFMFGFQATGLFQQYLSNPVATSVSVTFEKVCVWTGKYFIHMVWFALLLPSCHEIWNKCADNLYQTILLISQPKNAQVATSLLTSCNTVAMSTSRYQDACRWWKLFRLVPSTWFVVYLKDAYRVHDSPKSSQLTSTFVFPFSVFHSQPWQSAIWTCSAILWPLKRSWICSKKICSILGVKLRVSN